MTPFLVLCQDLGSLLGTVVLTGLGTVLGTVVGTVVGTVDTVVGGLVTMLRTRNVAISRGFAFDAISL